MTEIFSTSRCVRELYGKMYIAENKKLELIVATKE